MYANRRERLDELMRDRGYAAVWFARPQTFAWLTGGNNLISDHGESGAAAVGYDGDGVTVVTNNIERERLRDEELPGDVLVESYPWERSTLEAAIHERTSTPAAADIDISGLDRIDGSVLRHPLTGEDVNRYRALGRDTAIAVERALDDVDDTDSERQVAGRVSKQLHSRGVRSPVLLVGGARRCQRYRHFTPTGEELGGYAIVSVVGYRHGLHASVTRTVAFDPPSWFESRFRKTRRIEVSTLRATQRIGRANGQAHEVFSTIQDAYLTAGHPEEWRHHHQGGAAGYASREWKATPTLETAVSLPMAFAWNPTIQGAKSEGTWLVEEDDIESLTPAGEGWPSESVSGFGTDQTLELPIPRHVTA